MRTDSLSIDTIRLPLPAMTFIEHLKPAAALVFVAAAVYGCTASAEAPPLKVTVWDHIRGSASAASFSSAPSAFFAVAEAASPEFPHSASTCRWIAVAGSVAI